MLSERIESVRDVLAIQRERGEPIGLDQMGSLLQLLADWARYARPLEMRPVPTHARLDPAALPAGVIPFRRSVAPPSVDCPDGAA